MPTARGGPGSAVTQQGAGLVSQAWQLAVDFGTTRTVAAARRLQGNHDAEVLRMGQAFEVSSAVIVSASGEVVAGPQAERDAPNDPSRVVAQPKRLLADADEGGSLLIDGQLRQDVDLVSAVLRFAYEEARALFNGDPPKSVVLTCPVAWSDNRRDRLCQAATLADIPRVLLLEEPIAAAVNLLRRDSLADVPDGSRVVVYDFGGGTLDIAILRRHGQTFVLDGPTGGSDVLGGENIDDQLQRWILDELSDEDRAGLLDAHSTAEPEVWNRAAYQIRREAREAKEALLHRRVQTIRLPSPPLSISELELDETILRDRVGGMLGSAIDCLARLLEEARVEPSELAAIYLVGGCSRLSLLKRVLGERFPGIPLPQGADPKQAVALGAAEWQLGDVASDEHAGDDLKPAAAAGEDQDSDAAESSREVAAAQPFQNAAPAESLARRPPPRLTMPPPPCAPPVWHLSVADLIWPDRVSTPVEITRWLIDLGDPFPVGQPLFSARPVSPDGLAAHRAIDVCARCSGRLRRLLGDVGTIVDPGAWLADVDVSALPYRPIVIGPSATGLVLAICPPPKRVSDPRRGVMVNLNNTAQRLEWGQTYLLPLATGRHALSIYYEGKHENEGAVSTIIKTKNHAITTRVYETARVRGGNARLRTG
jgi:actin-like ATPase involved in cell morphogenesis